MALRSSMVPDNTVENDTKGGASMPGSYRYFDPQALSWLNDHFSPSSILLDVGPGQGKWGRYMQGSCTMDAVEPFYPYIYQFKLREVYRRVFNTTIQQFVLQENPCEGQHYDLAIFGDIIEHLSVEDAQTVLGYFHQAGTKLLVQVPYLYKQGKLAPEDYEDHRQEDLTHELMSRRYPMLIPLIRDDAMGVYIDNR